MAGTGGPAVRAGGGAGGGGAHAERAGELFARLVLPAVGDPVHGPRGPAAARGAHALAGGVWALRGAERAADRAGEVPYAGASYPAWFVPAASGGAEPRPAVFYLPGWDSTKEQGIELAEALAPRGFHTLLCDGPGVGEAVLFRGMVNRYDYEAAGSAAFDYLAGRPDVTRSDRGGRREPWRLSGGRVAAFEHRLAGAVAWGAVWDWRKVWAVRRSNAQGPVPTPQAHALFVMGARDLDDVTAKMEDWHLDEVAHQIRCPLLILHGHDDAQVPVDDAHRLYEAAGAAQKELKVFTAAREARRTARMTIGSLPTNTSAIG